MSRSPSSMRRAISTSPSRVSSATDAIWRRYMRTGSTLAAGSGLGGDRCRFADVLFGVAAVRLRHRDVVVLRVERPEHGDHAVETLEGAVIGVLRRLLRYLIPAHLWKPSPLVCASCVLRGCW